MIPLIFGPLLIAIYQFIKIKDFWFHYDEWIFFKQFENWHQYFVLLYEERHLITIPNYLFKISIKIFGYSTHIPNTLILVITQFLINVTLIYILNKKFNIRILYVNLIILLWLTNSSIRENFRWPMATTLLISLLCSLLIYSLNKSTKFKLYLNMFLTISIFSSGWIFPTFPIVIFAILQSSNNIKKKIGLIFNASIYPLLPFIYSFYSISAAKETPEDVSINLIFSYIVQQVKENYKSLFSEIPFPHYLNILIFFLTFFLYFFLKKNIIFENKFNSGILFTFGLFFCYLIFPLSIVYARFNRGLEILSASRYLYLTNLFILISLIVILNYLKFHKIIYIVMVPLIIIQSISLDKNLKSDIINEKQEFINFQKYRDVFVKTGKVYQIDYEICCKLDPALDKQDIGYIFQANFQDIFSIKNKKS